MYETTYLPLSSFSDLCHRKSLISRVTVRSSELLPSYDLSNQHVPKPWPHTGLVLRLLTLNKKIFKDQIRKCTKMVTLGYICLYQALPKISTTTTKTHLWFGFPLQSVPSESPNRSPAAWIAQSHHGHGHLRPTSMGPWGHGNPEIPRPRPTTGPGPFGMFLKPWDNNGDWKTTNRPQLVS